MSDLPKQRNPLAAFDSRLRAPIWANLFVGAQIKIRLNGRGHLNVESLPGGNLASVVELPVYPKTWLTVQLVETGDIVKVRTSQVVDERGKEVADDSAVTSEGQAVSPKELVTVRHRSVPDHDLRPIRKVVRLEEPAEEPLSPVRRHRKRSHSGGSNSSSGSSGSSNNGERAQKKEGGSSIGQCEVDTSMYIHNPFPFVPVSRGYCYGFGRGYEPTSSISSSSGVATASASLHTADCIVPNMQASPVPVYAGGDGPGVDVSADDEAHQIAREMELMLGPSTTVSLDDVYSAMDYTPSNSPQWLAGGGGGQQRPARPCACEESILHTSTPPSSELADVDMLGEHIVSDDRILTPRPVDLPPLATPHSSGAMLLVPKPHVACAPTTEAVRKALDAREKARLDYCRTVAFPSLWCYRGLPILCSPSPASPRDFTAADSMVYVVLGNCVSLESIYLKLHSGQYDSSASFSSDVCCLFDLLRSRTDMFGENELESLRKVKSEFDDVMKAMEDAMSPHFMYAHKSPSTALYVSAV